MNRRRFRVETCGTQDRPCLVVTDRFAGGAPVTRVLRDNDAGRSEARRVAAELNELDLQGRYVEADPHRTEAAILEVAQEHLGLEVLEVQGRDALDFHDCSVAGLRSALEAAFRAGLAAGAGKVQA